MCLTSAQCGQHFAPRGGGPWCYLPEADAAVCRWPVWVFDGSQQLSSRGGQCCHPVWILWGPAGRGGAVPSPGESPRGPGHFSCPPDPLGVNLRLSERRMPLWPWSCMHTWSGYWPCPVLWAEIHSTSGLWTWPAFWQWKPLYHELQLQEPGLQVSRYGGQRVKEFPWGP